MPKASHHVSRLTSVTLTGHVDCAHKLPHHRLQRLKCGRWPMRSSRRPPFGQRLACDRVNAVTADRLEQHRIYSWAHDASWQQNPQLLRQGDTLHTGRWCVPPPLRSVVRSATVAVRYVHELVAWLSTGVLLYVSSGVRVFVYVAAL